MQSIVNLFHVRYGAAVLRVGNDDLAGVDEGCRNVTGNKCGGDDHARQSLAKGDDIVGSAWGKLADSRDAPKQFLERVELGAQFAVQLGVQARAQQFAGSKVVALAKAAADIEGLVALATSGRSGHGQQLVGNPGHGADHNERALDHARFHNAGDAIDGRGILDRGATELHDDHRRTAWGNSPVTATDP